MAKKELVHFEEYVYLPALTHNRAIVAWGGFYFDYKFKDGEQEWDDGAKELPKGRKETIGIRSTCYGPAEVEFTEVATDIRRTRRADLDKNHAVLDDLKPDTEYRYKVMVNGREWAAGPRRDWNFSKDDDGGLFPRSDDRQYDNVFCTFPSPTTPAASLTFAVIGDFGRGVKEPIDKNEVTCQGMIAEALEAAVTDKKVRFILTTGDNIYAGRTLFVFTNDEGEEDDDWFFTYFQPYRYIINRVPVFPVVGNHDSKESEREADRSQIYDNFYLSRPYHQLRAEEDCQADHNGLFYRFSYGSDIELFCLDTSRDGSQTHFDTTQNRSLLDRFLGARNAPSRLRIAYSHHPPYCAGPQHGSMIELQNWMQSTGEPHGIRVFFSGHEHNFQYAEERDVHYFITGGGGKYRTGAPKKDKLEDAKIVAWGGNDGGHFLLVEVEGSLLTVTPFGHLRDGDLQPITINQAHKSSETPDFPPFRVRL